VPSKTPGLLSTLVSDPNPPRSWRMATDKANVMGRRPPTNRFENPAPYEWHTPTHLRPRSTGVGRALHHHRSPGLKQARSRPVRHSGRTVSDLEGMWTYKPHERPEVEVLVNGVWRPGQLRATWRRRGRRFCSVSWTEGPGTTRSETLPAARVRPAGQAMSA
jgi:hypothetical protein